MGKRVLLLGGTGNAGKSISQLLCSTKLQCDVIVTSRNLSKSKSVIKELDRLHDHQVQFIPAKLDASNYDEMINIMKEVDIVLVTGSVLDQVELIIKATLEANIDYYDLLLSSPLKISILEKYKTEIKQKGRIFVTDGGFHPGVPAAMIRYSKAVLGKLKDAHVYAALRMNWNDYQFSKETMVEFVEEFKHFQPIVLQQGKWLKQNMTKLIPFDFGHPFGNLHCTPMLLEEIKRLPKSIPTIQNTGFFISGFNWLSDYLITPLVWYGAKFLPDKLHPFLSKLLLTGMRQSKPPYGCKLVSVGTGHKNQKHRLEFTHTDAYLLTAAPVVAGLIQYLDGKMNAGLHFQALTVDPTKFFADLGKMGIEIREELS